MGWRQGNAVFAGPAVIAIALLAPSTSASTGHEVTASSAPSPASHLMPTGRLMSPASRQISLGNFTTGAAVTADGRWLWALSTGFSNDLRIVDLTAGRVCQVIPLAGASGGIAIDSKRHRAYVAGLQVSRWYPSQAALPGAQGDVIHVFGYTDRCGQAAEITTLNVPVPPNAPPVQNFNAQRPGVLGQPAAWLDRLAVSPDGRRLLVPLNLADSAAIVDTTGVAPVRYVSVGHYPFAAAITPDGRTGLVTNEGTGSMSVIDLDRGVVSASIQVGGNLSHPQAVIIDRAGTTAYVAVAESDWVSVVDLAKRKVRRSVFVGRPEGRGVGPVALTLTPDERRLLVANVHSDEIAVVALPSDQTPRSTWWSVLGRIPTASEPMTVQAFVFEGRARFAYTTAKGFGVGANPNGPSPTNPDDPIFWAFKPQPPTFDVFASSAQVYGATLVTGTAAVADVPTDRDLVTLTARADSQLVPVGRSNPPAGSVVRDRGPIRHVFFIVRENRSYDQVLGSIGKGRSDPTLAVFDASTSVPNLHALANRFGLLDNTYANSEASIDGHAITATGTVAQYVNLNWWQNYAARGRPADGQYAISFPSTGSLFEKAQKQGISYFNYGEAITNVFPDLKDKDRGPVLTRRARQVAAHSDIGPPTGCYPGSYTIGMSTAGTPIFDSSLPAGAPAGSFSHMDCFTQRFAQQLATDSVPALNYISMTADHTLGTMPGAYTPTAMVADSDVALGQLVSLISHSSIWPSSAIFMVEDDSQDGADHISARRIPALVISPYSPGGVISERYDVLSVLRTIEILIGMEPLTINDALASPMYSAFANRAVNAAPFDVIPAKVDLLAKNSPQAPGAKASQRMLGNRGVDEVPQWWLDGIIWRSVRGASSQPPPPGPDAAYQSWADVAAEDD